MWHYLYFTKVCALRPIPKSLTKFPQERNLDWFPRMRSMSLAADDGDNEQNDLRTFQAQLEQANLMIATLSRQLNELNEQVRQQQATSRNKLATKTHQSNGSLHPHMRHGSGAFTKGWLEQLNEPFTRSCST